MLLFQLYLSPSPFLPPVLSFGTNHFDSFHFFSYQSSLGHISLSITMMMGLQPFCNRTLRFVISCFSVEMFFHKKRQQPDWFQEISWNWLLSFFMTKNSHMADLVRLSLMISHLVDPSLSSFHLISIASMTHLV